MVSSANKGSRFFRRGLFFIGGRRGPAQLGAGPGVAGRSPLFCTHQTFLTQGDDAEEEQWEPVEGMEYKN